MSPLEPQDARYARNARRGVLKTLPPSLSSQDPMNGQPPRVPLFPRVIDTKDQRP